MMKRRFMAEWEPQQAVLVAWPHRLTDWCDTLERVEQCYRQVVQTISQDEPVIIVAPEPEQVRHSLHDIDAGRITIVALPTNDTWARDFGPLSIATEQGTVLLDFTFNAWGMKFAADKDNLINSRLAGSGVLRHPVENHRDMVLEGGSVETDGRGLLLTTSQCLLSPNRNAHWQRDDIECQLRRRLGVTKVLWLDYGAVPGDDTDCHIDTLARLTPSGTVLHVTAQPDNEEYAQTQLMIEQLQTMTDTDGRPLRLEALPAPAPIVDSSGRRLPATYANYLVTNHQVLVPTYGQPVTDRLAIETIGSVFADRTVVGIDCRALIEQHGSLHCITMQLH